MHDEDDTAESATGFETRKDATEPVTSTDKEAETFPADVVRKLREESARYRTRAKDAEARVDGLSRALFQARVTATGKLADPTDLDYDAELLDDAGKLTEAIDALTARKPHLAARKVTGSVGQGQRGNNAAPPLDFSALLR